MCDAPVGKLSGVVSGNAERRAISIGHANERDWHAIIVALVRGSCSEGEVRLSLAALAGDPLAQVYAFRGDLLRALMEVPNAFWGRHPELYEQYREMVRAGALARRNLPNESKEEFWSPLELED